MKRVETQDEQRIARGQQKEHSMKVKDSKPKKPKRILNLAICCHAPFSLGRSAEAQEWKWVQYLLAESLAR